MMSCLRVFRVILFGEVLFGMFSVIGVGLTAGGSTGVGGSISVNCFFAIVFPVAEAVMTTSLFSTGVGGRGETGGFGGDMISSIGGGTRGSGTIGFTRDQSSGFDKIGPITGFITIGPCGDGGGTIPANPVFIEVFRSLLVPSMRVIADNARGVLAIEINPIMRELRRIIE
jgi:hypothetical protein